MNETATEPTTESAPEEANGSESTSEETTGEATTTEEAPKPKRQRRPRKARPEKAEPTSDGEAPAPEKEKAKPAPKPKAPPVYGGTAEAPALGANGRRLWGFLNQVLSQKNLRAIRARVLADHPTARGETDRFIRWEQICAAAAALEIQVPATSKDSDPVPINETLVRKLATVENAKELGRTPKDFVVTGKSGK